MNNVDHATNDYTWLVEGKNLIQFLAHSWLSLNIYETHTTRSCLTETKHITCSCIDALNDSIFTNSEHWIDDRIQHSFNVNGLALKFVKLGNITNVKITIQYKSNEPCRTFVSFEPYIFNCFHPYNLQRCSDAYQFFIISQVPYKSDKLTTWLRCSLNFTKRERHGKHSPISPLALELVCCNQAKKKKNTRISKQCIIYCPHIEILP